MNTNDPEIAFAAELGMTLARMRAELGDVYIKTMPAPKRSEPERVIERGVPLVPAQNAPATIEATRRATCPICGWGTITEKGLSLHMYRKHGTSHKEYARQQALDHEEVQP